MLVRCIVIAMAISWYGTIPFELLVVWVHGLAVAVETSHGVRVVAAGYLKGIYDKC